jgi:hypothetical protein
VPDHRRGVRLVGQTSGVVERVDGLTDLRRVEEPGRAPHGRRDARLGERRLEGLRLAVDTEAHGHLARGNTLAHQLARAGDDSLDLRGVVGEPTDLGDRTTRGLRPQALTDPAASTQDGVGQGEHLLCRTVVVDQLDDPGAGEVADEACQVRVARPGERVDGLVVVADHADIVAVAQPGP